MNVTPVSVLPVTQPEVHRAAATPDAVGRQFETLLVEAFLRPLESSVSARGVASAAGAGWSGVLLTQLAEAIVSRHSLGLWQMIAARQAQRLE